MRGAGAAGRGDLTRRARGSGGWPGWMRSNIIMRIHQNNRNLPIKTSLQLLCGSCFDAGRF
jgi:hypothetical protein